MAADSDYSDVLERLADSHQQRIADSLVALEERVASFMSGAPIKDGKLFDLEWAVNARAELRSALDETYLSEVDSILRSYNGVSNAAEKMLGTYGDFTKLDAGVVGQLQRLSFQGFEDIGSEYLDTLASEVYQSTLTGRNFNDTVKNLRQTINGVYINSDDAEAQRLVDVAANGTAAQSAAAVKELQTKYARDRVGNNLRRYSTQMAQDSLMQFDASINTAIGKQSGASKWKYYGSTVRDSRPFCVEHAGQIFTDDEIEETWSGSWKGKASGDPFIVRGGYNCRHHWRPVFDEEPEEAELENTKTEDKNKVDVFSDEATFSSKDKTTKAQINSAMSLVTPTQIALINRLPKPKAVVAKANGGLYDSRTNTLTSGMQRGGATVRHEYGHHIDYMLGEESGRFGAPALSTFDVGFNDAFKADRKGLNLQSKKLREDSLESLRDELYDNKITSFKLPNGNTRFVNNYVIKTDELAAVADIVDAMSDGLFTKRFGGWGHGVAYYKRRGAKQKETFANLFALRNTPEWEVVQKNFPLVAKRFDEIIDGKI